jgi:hypothetical protein
MRLEKPHCVKVKLAAGEYGDVLVAARRSGLRVLAGGEHRAERVDGGLVY